ncbi:MAG: twin-arginine translocase TatA/TatE family subunit [Actinomycetes bacterium]
MRALFDSPAAIVLLLIVIVLFGARRLPDAARSVGKSIKIFKDEMDNGKNENSAEKPDDKN